MAHSHRNIDRHRWAIVRRKVLERDNYTCLDCGRHGFLEVDHMKPLYDGGAKYDLSNLQSLCKFCHRIKTTQEKGRPSPKGRREWLEKLRDAV